MEGLEISEVMLSEVKKENQSIRIDSQYFKKQFLQFLQKTLDANPLEFFVKNGYRVVYENTKIISKEEAISKDYPYFLQATDLETPFIKMDNLFYVDQTEWIRYPKGRVNKGEILIEVKGKIEKVSIVPEDFPEKTLISGSLFKLTTNEKISKYVLLCYLLCKYGVAFKERYKTNLLISYISKPDLYRMPIPKFSNAFQEQIDQIFKLIFQSKNQSKLLYTRAENLLLESLGLNEESLDCHEAKASRNDGVVSSFPNLLASSLRGVATPRRGNPELQNQQSDKFSHLSINQKSFQESFLKTGRLDAEYYQPKYEEITNQIKLREYAKLSDLVLIQKSIEPGSEAYLENGLEFIRVANLNKFSISKSEIFLDEEKYSGTIKPKKDTILLSKDGTVGIAYKVSEDLNCITSGAILHLTINQTNILPDYLTLVLNSKLVQMQAERDSGGSIIQHWKPSEIMEILIPILDQPTQAKISSLIQTSFTLKAKSEKLLETAKKAVEMAIEDSEERALEFILMNK